LIQHFFHIDLGMPLRLAFLAVACAAALQACVLRWDDSGADSGTRSASTDTSKRSKRGNPPFYEVYGVRYYVLDTSYGYQERGVASWYGKKFHGRPTSSGETYNMYRMTAAHKTVPLPTRMRITHLGNGKSIEVIVNDRGPFVDNRIIDLSYAAAVELDMIGTGTAMVEIETLSGPGAPPAPVQTAAAAPLMTDLEPPAATPESTPAGEIETRLYLQVGAFGDRINAQQLQNQLELKGLANVFIREDLATSPALYRVRIGPVSDVANYDALVELTASMQITETHLVTETGRPDQLDIAPAAPPAALTEDVTDGVSVSGALSGG
jgi:rare lipoprotein A